MCRTAEEHVSQVTILDQSATAAYAAHSEDEGPHSVGGRQLCNNDGAMPCHSTRSRQSSVGFELPVAVICGSATDMLILYWVPRFQMAAIRTSDSRPETSASLVFEKAARISERRPCCTFSGANLCALAPVRLPGHVVDRD